MDNEAELDTISLWGVLHEGELRKIRSDRDRLTAGLDFVVPHLNYFYGWAPEAPIRFEFQGVTRLGANEWVPEPAPGNEDIGTRRWFRREWTDLEEAIPPNWIDVSDASLTSVDDSGHRIQVSGYENMQGERAKALIEVVVFGTVLKLATPEGPCDVDRLLQVGDAYWDNLGKKRKR